MRIGDYIILGIIILWFIYCIVLFVRRSRGGKCISCDQCSVRRQMTENDEDQMQGDAVTSNRNCRKCMAHVTGK